MLSRNTVIYRAIVKLLYLSTIFLCSSIQLSWAIDNRATPQIIGGTETAINEYPFIAAIVNTNNTFPATLTIDNDSIDSLGIDGTIVKDFSGALIDCGIGSQPCENAQDKVCLIKRGDITFTEKVTTCRDSGGIGAIVFNNIDESVMNWVMDEGIVIPAIGVQLDVGNTLLTKIDQSITVTFGEPTFTQSAFCGGTLIGESWILTAAHCVKERRPDGFKVNVGEHDLSNGAELASTVKSIFIHPEYNELAIANDIAILELETPINGPTVSLASMEQLNSAIVNNSPALTIGWGGRKPYASGSGETTDDFPDVLHKATIGIISNETCNQTMNDFVKEDMICAGVPSGAQSTCQGDSGGPLLIEQDAVWYQTGITSWGIGCGQPGRYSVFNRVPVFTSWINDIQNGFAAKPLISLGNINAGKTTQTELLYTNRGQAPTTATFALSGAQSEFFKIVGNTCDGIPVQPGGECLLTVDFTSSKSGVNSASIDVSSSDNTVPGVTSNLTAQVLDDVTNVLRNPSGNDDAITWFSGGDTPWAPSPDENYVQSGNITDSQESRLRAQVSGTLQISFEWSVDSDAGAGSFEDTLFFFVDGVFIDSIQGVIDWKEVVFEFDDDGDHTLEWVYVKDNRRNNGYTGADQALLRNVSSKLTTDGEGNLVGSNDSDDEGGSLNIIILMLFFGLTYTRLYNKQARLG